MIPYRYSLLLLLMLGCACCKPASTDPAVVDNPEPAANVWKSADSLLNVTNHTGLGVYADSLGIVFTTQDGLFFRKKGSTRITYVAYKPYGNSAGPTFYNGMAYFFSSDQSLIGIPYGQTDRNLVTLSLRDFDLPNTPTGRADFSYNYPISINNKGQMLVQLDAETVPQYLYSLQLDATARPLRNSGKLINKQVLFNDLSYSFTNAPLNGFYSYGYYTVGDQLFASVLRHYTQNQDSTCLGELQRVTSDGTVETVFPKLSTKNLIAFKGNLYAIAAPPSGTLAMYRSTDNGRTWTNLYAIDHLYNAVSSSFSVVDNRLVVTYLKGYKLQEFNIETGQTRDLDLSGIPDFRGDITGLVEYEGNVYITTTGKGIYVKNLNGFWK